MEWHISPNNKLIIWPLLVFLLINGLAWFSSLHLFSQILILTVSSLWVKQFLYKNILLTASDAVIAIRFQQDNFSIRLYDSLKTNSPWIKVKPVNGSLVSYWLIAVEWQQLDKNGVKSAWPFWCLKKKYKSILTPDMFSDDHFRDLLRTLHLSRKTNSD